MTLTSHKTRCVFDRYNIVNERDLLSAGQLVAYLDAKAEQETPATLHQARPAK